MLSMPFLLYSRNGWSAVDTPRALGKCSHAFKTIQSNNLFQGGFFFIIIAIFMRIFSQVKKNLGNLRHTWAWLQQMNVSLQISGFIGKYQSIVSCQFSILKTLFYLVSEDVLLLFLICGRCGKGILLHRIH